MKLEDLRIYQMALEIGEVVWNEVSKWNYFEKDTIGKQLVRSADSIAANISEGFGRFFYRETKQFGYYSRGSLYGTKTWLEKAYQRRLINAETHERLMKDIDILAIKLNKYLQTIGSNRQEPGK